MQYKRFSKKTVKILTICLLMTSLTWATTYLELANSEARANGWYNPTIKEHAVSGNLSYLFNDDAYNYFLLYGLTLGDTKIPTKPKLSWYQSLFIGFAVGTLYGVSL